MILETTFRVQKLEQVISPNGQVVKTLAPACLRPNPSSAAYQLPYHL